MRALRISLIVLGILVGLFIAADRVAVFIAQGEVASRARDGLGLGEEPDVSIKGFPFLTQVMGQELNHVTLGLDEYQAQVDGQTVTLTDLDIDVRNTEVSSSYSEAVAEEANGSGTITYEEITRAYGELLGSQDTGFGGEFEHAGGDQLRITLQATVMGQNVDVGNVTGGLVVEGDTIRLEILQDEIPDSIPGGADFIRQQLSIERTISGLPNGLRLESVVPGEDGLTVNIVGSNVSLAG